MSILAKHRVVFSLATALFILVFAAAAIFWARGFKPNFKTGKIERTGLLVVTSTPTGAQVYLDDRLTSATDTNIAFLEPKVYKLRIAKDGFTTWEKDVEIKADLATEIKAFLFSVAPEIKPLTISGAIGPSLSPDGTKIVYATSDQRGGLYLMPLSSSPLPFRQSPRLLIKDQAGFNFSKSKFIWSPDSKQLIAYFQDEKGTSLANLLLDVEKTDQEVRDITAALAATLESWREELSNRATTQATVAPQSVKEATAEAKIEVGNQKPASPRQTSQQPTRLIAQLNYYPTGLIFSPDEEKILYKNKEGKYKIFDLKLDKEYQLPDFPELIAISWLPDSNHLIVAQKDLVAIIEADGANKITVFSGKYENGFVAAHPSGNRLIILTTLTQTEGTLPNLYAVNLR